VVTADEFAAFQAAAGHRVVCSPSSYWCDVSFGFFLSCPSHRLLTPSENELRSLIRHQPCLGVRFAGPASGPGKRSYQIVCNSRDYSIDGLSANTRSKVRRGLRRCDVGPVSFEELATHGGAADVDTVTRQGRRAWVNGKRWTRFWRAAAGRPGIEGWAARTGSEILAFLVTVQFDDAVDFMMARSRSEHNSTYANNALIFQVTEEMLVRRRVREITFGLEALEPVASLDQFKLSMGFGYRPLKQRVEFHPLFRVLACNPVVRSALYRWAKRGGPDGTFWRKTAGLLRFAEDGGF
jgi:hypothetical protein